MIKETKEIVVDYFSEAEQDALRNKLLSDIDTKIRKLEEKRTEIIRITDLMFAGFELKNVKCHKHYDYENNNIRVVRLDSDEEIENREMSANERKTYEDSAFWGDAVTKDLDLKPLNKAISDSVDYEHEKKNQEAVGDGSPEETMGTELNETDAGQPEKEPMETSMAEIPSYADVPLEEENETSGVKPPPEKKVRVEDDIKNISDLGDLPIVGKDEDAKTEQLEEYIPNKEEAEKLDAIEEVNREHIGIPADDSENLEGVV